MFGVGHFWEILILLVIVLLVFGPGKLPEVGSALGRGIREFKDATTGNHDQANYQPPVISQTPPARPIQEPQQWQAPVVEQREPVTAEPKSGER
ncbi:MAG TPA: twin-arginine translocase TatA/TatE family subunit [Chloroflexota bacterium]|jgi:sec-independent protein translocase protein TatA|nr:twin-arginine translocase TatA/TatE family subunit [Chloroflexota bacterium]